ncbi:GIY-YIG nuclease family protein [Bacillus sp. ISL-46]|uniref:GIY-YIG nuclease family protein n=1 Tax=Bacillus sp. ISL-46 TaxID=2819129 RepID=UPI0020352DDF|nr:GIY-YIG nuclease family protein [Bacillus sp. ISL-46]
MEQISFDIMTLKPLEIKTLTRYNFPKKGGVYLFTTKDDECVYAGKTGDLRDRVFDVHLNGKGKSSFRQALLGQKKTRKLEAVTTDDEIDYYIEKMFLIRFVVIEDILLRGCVEDFLNAILKPMYSVSLSMK